MNREVKGAINAFIFNITFLGVVPELLNVLLGQNTIEITKHSYDSTGLKSLTKAPQRIGRVTNI